MRVSVEPAAPQPASLAAVQEAARAMHPQDPQIAEWFHTYADVHSSRVAQDIDIIDRFVGKKEAIVDVASVPLLLLWAMKKRGNWIEGIDLHPERFGKEIEEGGLLVRQCDIEREKLPYPDSSIDVAVFNEIFEHLRINPIHTMQQIHRIIKPSGLLFLSTPNGLSLMHLINFFRYRSMGPDIYEEYDKINKIGHMGHVREYAMVEVSRFLNRIGFVVEEIIWRGGYGSRRFDLPCSIWPSLRPYFSLVARRQ